ncbi:uncharacterized protein LOC120838860 [Ixodes scapularis]|uniref:uncharacterized protein LOC120838860 n=1 Tax=Ixodes scapularis TaxID=6945 RepID=UPI001A9F552D|nr:uncharacterized protein LOC120838860 [Ixodes scapularis]
MEQFERPGSVPNAEQQESVYFVKDEDAESAQVVEYADKIVIYITKLKSQLRRSTGAGHSASASQLNENGDRLAASTSKKVRLPKLELIKFNGHLKNWLPFWNQFDAAIHQNPDLTSCDKFNYLKAALTGDGAAAIDGLQPTAECYADAIELLQRRFGNQEALIQDHMESLMDIQRVPPQRNVRILRRLYDSLQARIRGLKALGVSEESYCSMLYPVLLRALPREMTIEYHRKTLQGEAESATTSRSAPASQTTLGPTTDRTHPRALRTLLEFLHIEVESQEKASKERPEEVGGKSTPHFTKREAQKTSTDPDMPRTSTATALHGVLEGLECFFCSSKKHGTPDCNSRITLAEKTRRLQNAQRCFRCTKVGHMARICRGTPCCNRCRGRHTSSMCDPDYTRRRSADGFNAQQKKDEAPVSLHVNEENKPAVLLQTVTAVVEGKNRKKRARIPFDSGSQRSFITKELSRSFGCKLLGTEILTVGVFGGKNRERTYRRVQVILRNQHSGKEYKIDALETHSISEQELPGPEKDVIGKMEELGLTSGDDVNGLDCGGVAILLGSEHYWECITGRIQRLSNSLTAVETAFGWAIHGSTQLTSDTVNYSQVIVLISAVDEQEPSILRRFWELESVGLLEETDRDQSDNDIMRRFEASIAKTKGRYEVGLSWKTDVQLECNRDVAWKRLESLRRKLSKNPDLMRSAVLKKMLEDNVSEERALGQLTGVVKVLGITWESNEDKLSFTTEQVVEFTSQRRNNKRFVPQTTARLYDPLGFLSPFVTRAKILFQETWKRNLRWDDALPGELMGDWESWCDELT